MRTYCSNILPAIREQLGKFENGLEQNGASVSAEVRPVTRDVWGIRAKGGRATSVLRRLPRILFLPFTSRRKSADVALVLVALSSAGLLAASGRWTGRPHMRPMTSTGATPYCVLTVLLSITERTPSKPGPLLLMGSKPTCRWAEV
jgi:hypothetical protein